MLSSSLLPSDGTLSCLSSLLLTLSSIVFLLVSYGLSIYREKCFIILFFSGWFKVQANIISLKKSMISSVFKSIFFICRRYSFSIFQRSTLHFQPSKLYIIFYLFYMNFLRRFVRRYLYAFVFNILFTYLFQKTFFRVFISDLFSKNFPIFRQSRTKLVAKT